MERTQDTLRFQGIRVHYTLTVPDEAPLHRVMLLSGAMTSSFSWRKLMPELEETGCLTCEIDLPGFGKSANPPELLYDTDITARILWGVLDEIDSRTGADRATWHMISQGPSSRFVMAMHDECPDSVRSQLHLSPLLDPAPIRRLIGHDRKKWYARSVENRRGFQALTQQLAGYPLDRYVLDAMREPLLFPGAENALASCVKEPLKPLHPGFCPTMVIWGGRDPLMNGAEKQLDRFMPGSERHIMKSAGHFLTETHSAAVRDYLRGWLRYLM